MQLSALAHAAAWVFVSPAAVRFAWQAAPELTLPRGTRVFAVGPGTVAALSRRGVAALHPSLRHDSEGLLALPELADMRGAVALVTAPGGRSLIADTLRGRGLEVHGIAAYRRMPARWDRRHRARLDDFLRARPRALWIATSGEALAALAGLAGPAFEALLDVPLVVGSARLSAVATALGLRDVHAATGTTPAALVEGALGIERGYANSMRGDDGTESP